MGFQERKGRKTTEHQNPKSLFGVRKGKNSLEQNGERGNHRLVRALRFCNISSSVLVSDRLMGSEGERERERGRRKEENHSGSVGHRESVEGGGRRKEEEGGKKEKARLEIAEGEKDGGKNNFSDIRMGEKKTQGCTSADRLICWLFNPRSTAGLGAADDFTSNASCMDISDQETFAQSKHRLAPSIGIEINPLRHNPFSSLACTAQ